MRQVALIAFFLALLLALAFGHALAVSSLETRPSITAEDPSGVHVREPGQ